jgi:type II secretory pathway pseudopilin PulG
MNINLKIKLLQHCLNKKQNQGFTLTEAVIILLIFGALLILAIPVLLHQEHRIGASEAKSYIGSMNRAQQAYFLESKGKFAKTIKEMYIGIKEETENYKYYTKVKENAAFNYAIARRPYIKINWFNRKTINSYVGAIFPIPTGNKSEFNTIAIICENNQPGSTNPAEPTYKNGVIQCPAGTKQVSR